MKKLLIIFFVLLLCASAHAQTIHTVPVYTNYSYLRDSLLSNGKHTLRIKSDSLIENWGYVKFIRQIIGDIDITGNFKINGVTLSSSTRPDTTIIFYKSDTLNYYTKYNLDTTKTPKLGMNNTFTGSNIFTKDLSFTKGSYYSLGTTDNYGMKFKVNGTNYMRVDSLGSIRGNHPSYDNYWYITRDGSAFFASIATNGVFIFSNYLYSTAFQGQNGSPEGVTTYTMGSYVARKDGGIGTSAYIKETTSGNTGWNPVKTNKSDTLTTYASSRTVTMLGTVLKCTPTQNCTFNASGGVAGNQITFYFTTSGTTDFRITFGTNFRSSGVIDMGTTTAKVHTVTFVCKDGTEWAEVSRVMNM